MAYKIILPGLIDVHVHFRDPGQTHKEDFYTGTLAALAGGFTTVIDMPNNAIPITSQILLTEKIKEAKKKVMCDIGFHFGSLGNNFSEFSKVQQSVFGLKLYLNQTTGNFIIGRKELEKIYTSWKSKQPILLHAESDMLKMVFEIIKKTKRKTHICHVSSKKELELIIKAKKSGLPVTCGVTPHHLFLTKEDEKRLGAFGKMKPYLKSKTDVDFLWKNIEYVDVIESDHAPHTTREKNPSTSSGQAVPFGVPGLETTLPLLLKATEEGKISIDDIVQLCHTNPVKIFNIPTDEKTFVEVSMEKYKIQNKNLKTKCGWSPFNGMELVGKVIKVTLHGKVVYENGEVKIRKGEGKIISPICL